MKTTKGTRIDSVEVVDVPTWKTLSNEMIEEYADTIKDKSIFLDGFDDFMQRKIAHREAYKAIADETNEIAGIICISKKNNAITFFAVFSRYQRQCIGTILLKHALKNLDNERAIYANSFRADYRPGMASQIIYRKNGFITEDESAIESGVHVCRLKKEPQG
jgi:GNAT superfamily N-acetyltransferase